MRRLMRIAIIIAVVAGVAVLAARLFDFPYDGPLLVVAGVALFGAVVIALGSVIRGDGPWRNGPSANLQPARPGVPDRLRPASGTRED